MGGTDWHSLDSGLTTAGLLDFYGIPRTGSGWARALAVDNQGNVYVAGRFDEAGGIPSREFARWDGSEWHAVGDGSVISSIYGAAVTVGPDGSVYVSGHHRDDGHYLDGHVLKWNTDHWQPVGASFRRQGETFVAISELEFVDGKLYAAGSFAAAGLTKARNIAVWDGVQWSPLAGGLNGSVYELFSDGSGRLFVGGEFQWATTTPANNLAVWNGSNWLAVDEGVNGRIFALESDGVGGLYVGGSFYSVPGVPSVNFAHWYGARPVVEPPPEPSQTVNALTGPFPNPSDDMSSLVLTVESAQTVRATLYDLLGRQIAVLWAGHLEAGTEYPLVVDGRELPSGLYVVRVVGADFSATQNLVIAH